MNEHAAILVLLTGLLVAVAIFLKGLLMKVQVPPLVGFILLGFGVRLLDNALPVIRLDAGGMEILTFLAELGVIALLFRIGVERNISALLANLGKAGILGLLAVVLSGALGFAAAFWILNLDLTASIVVGTALTATSVGIPAQVWDRTQKIDTEPGRLFIDVAELDDIIGVMLLALLFSVLPVLQSTRGLSGLVRPLLGSAGMLVLKLAIFILGCMLFACFLERPLTESLARLEISPDPTLTVIAVGFVIAGAAGLMGFSLAIGAFFAGLIFSRDPDSLRDKTAFDMIYELFVPFFFIGIGLRIAPSAISVGLAAGCILLLVAVIGKFAGSFFPALILTSPVNAMLVGLSLVPRAEITMIIAQQSLQQDVISDKVFSALAVTCLGTCVAVPVLLNYLIAKSRL